MNPHRFSWGFAYNFPFAQVAAITVLIGLLIGKESRQFPRDKTIVVWILLIVWLCITTIFALEMGPATIALERTLKVQLMIFIGMWVMGTKERMIQWTWVTALSLAFFGVKGGIFAILTGGQFRVWGPQGSFIEGNNEIGLALIMTIPLLIFLRSYSKRKSLRFGLLGATVLTAIAILSTQSRGAMLGLCAMAVFLWLKSRHKLISGIAILLMAPVLFLFMPQSWHERMDTIQEYEQDSSAMGRLTAWEFAFTVANQRVTGAGAHSMSFERTYSRFSPELHTRIMELDGVFRATHSIYFGMLGQHGWIGLTLFLLLGIFGWRCGTWVIKHSRESEELTWCGDLASMLHVSMIGYAVTGTFLSLEYFDLIYQIMAMLILLKVIVRQTEDEIDDESITSHTPIAPGLR